jgi:putative transposase
MARPLRIAFPGAVYHITSRGDRQEDIFEDDTDRRTWLAVLGDALARFDAGVFAWCLMDNHYHLILHTRQANLSLLMRQLNGLYTQRYNHRHDQVGHVFQGRFKAILVDRDAYLLEVCRYVDLNRVRAGLVAHPEDWPWCSFPAMAGRTPCPPWLEREQLWSCMLGRDVTSAQDAQHGARAYADWVQAGQGVRLWAEHLRQQMYLGDEAYVQRMQSRAHAVALQQVEVPRPQKASPLSLDDWRKRCSTRDDAVRMAHTASKQTLSSIARELGLSVSRVSRIVSGFEAKGKT